MLVLRQPRARRKRRDGDDHVRLGPGTTIGWPVTVVLVRITGVTCGGGRVGSMRKPAAEKARMRRAQDFHRHTLRPLPGLE